MGGDCDALALPCRNVQDFQDIMKVNILGPFLVTHALLPLIRKGDRKQVPSTFFACFASLTVLS